MKEITFSSAQDPASWEPNGPDRGEVITCMTNADAKKAAALFNRMQQEIERLSLQAQARLEAITEEQEKHRKTQDMLRACREAAVPEGVQYVWSVANKTTNVLFASEEDAQAYRAGFSAAVGGGMSLNKLPVVHWTNKLPEPQHERSSTKEQT